MDGTSGIQEKVFTKQPRKLPLQFIILNSNNCKCTHFEAANIDAFLQ